MQRAGGVGQVGCAFTVEVRQQHDAAGAGCGRERELLELVARAAEQARRSCRSPWSRSTCTRAAGSGRWRRRTRPPRRWRRSSGAPDDREHRARRARARSRRRPRASPRPSAAPMLSPVPAATSASRVASGDAARREHRRRDVGIEVEQAEHVGDVAPGRRRPVPGARRVAAVGDQLAGELQRQPVVGEQHVRHACEHARARARAATRASSP